MNTLIPFTLTLLGFFASIYFIYHGVKMTLLLTHLPDTPKDVPSIIVEQRGVGERFAGVLLTLIGLVCFYALATGFRSSL
jgi:hypothetical protein